MDTSTDSNMDSMVVRLSVSVTMDINSSNLNEEMKYRNFKDLVYRRTYHVFIDVKDNEIPKVLEKAKKEKLPKHLIKSLEDEVEDNDINWVGTIYSTDESHMLIMLKKQKNLLDQLAIIAHESSHVTFNTLNRAGVVYDSQGGNEAFAYHIEFVFSHLLAIYKE